MEFNIQNARLRVGRAEAAGSGPSVAALSGMQEIALIPAESSGDAQFAWNPDPLLLCAGDYRFEFSYTFTSQDFIDQSVSGSRRKFCLSLMQQGAEAWAEGPSVANPEAGLIVEYCDGVRTSAELVLSNQSSDKYRRVPLEQDSRRVLLRREGTRLEAYLWDDAQLTWVLPLAYDAVTGGNVTFAQLDVSDTSQWPSVLPCAFAWTGFNEPMAPAITMGIDSMSLVDTAGGPVLFSNPLPLVETFEDAAWVPSPSASDQVQNVVVNISGEILTLTFDPVAGAESYILYAGGPDVSPESFVHSQLVASNDSMDAPMSEFWIIVVAVFPDNSHGAPSAIVHIPGPAVSAPDIANYYLYLTGAAPDTPQTALSLYQTSGMGSISGITYEIYEAGTTMSGVPSSTVSKPHTSPKVDSLQLPVGQWEVRMRLENSNGPGNWSQFNTVNVVEAFETTAFITNVSAHENGNPPQSCTVQYSCDAWMAPITAQVNFFKFGTPPTITDFNRSEVYAEPATSAWGGLDDAIGQELHVWMLPVVGDQLHVSEGSRDSQIVPGIKPISDLQVNFPGNSAANVDLAFTKAEPWSGAESDYTLFWGFDSSVSVSANAGSALIVPTLEGGPWAPSAGYVSASALPTNTPLYFVVAPARALEKNISVQCNVVGPITVNLDNLLHITFAPATDPYTDAAMVQSARTIESAPGVFEFGAVSGVITTDFSGTWVVDHIESFEAVVNIGDIPDAEQKDLLNLMINLTNDSISTSYAIRNLYLWRGGQVGAAELPAGIHLGDGGETNDVFLSSETLPISGSELRITWDAAAGVLTVYQNDEEILRDSSFVKPAEAGFTKIAFALGGSNHKGEQAAATWRGPFVVTAAGAAAVPILEDPLTAASGSSWTPMKGTPVFDAGTYGSADGSEAMAYKDIGFADGYSLKAKIANVDTIATVAFYVALNMETSMFYVLNCSSASGFELRNEEEGPPLDSDASPLAEGDEIEIRVLPAAAGIEVYVNGAETPIVSTNDNASAGGTCIALLADDTNTIGVNADSGYLLVEPL